MPHTLFGQLGAAVTLLACLFAIAKGGSPERLAGFTLLAAELAVVCFQDRVHFLDPQRRLLSIDVVLMVVFGTLLTSYPRKWLLPATALQILSTLLHFAALWSPDIDGFAYISLMALLGYGQLIVLVGGAGAIARVREKVEDDAAAEHANLLCDDFGSERALHWVGDALQKASSGERRRLVRVHAHIAKRDPLYILVQGNTPKRIIE